VFLWSGLAKVARPRRWLAQLRVHRLPRAVRAVALAGVPWGELAVVALFAAAKWRLAATVAAVMLVAFAVALVRLSILMDHAPVDCGCFGGTTPRDVRLLLARNAGLLVLAAMVIAHPVADDGAWWTVPVLTAWAAAALGWVVWQGAVRIATARSVRSAA
jgi:hypothetical protein